MTELPPDAGYPPARDPQSGEVMPYTGVSGALTEDTAAAEGTIVLTASGRREPNPGERPHDPYEQPVFGIDAPTQPMAIAAEPNAVRRRKRQLNLLAGDYALFGPTVVDGRPVPATRDTGITVAGGELVETVSRPDFQAAMDGGDVQPFLFDAMVRRFQAGNQRRAAAAVGEVAASYGFDLGLSGGRALPSTPGGQPAPYAIEFTMQLPADANGHARTVPEIGTTVPVVSAEDEAAATAAGSRLGRMQHLTDLGRAGVELTTEQLTSGTLPLPTEANDHVMFRPGRSEKDKITDRFPPQLLEGLFAAVRKAPTWGHRRVVAQQISDYARALDPDEYARKIDEAVQIMQEQEYRTAAEDPKYQPVTISAGAPSPDLLTAVRKLVAGEQDPRIRAMLQARLIGELKKILEFVDTESTPANAGTNSGELFEINGHMYRRVQVD